MNWIALLFYLEIGLLPGNSWIAYDNAEYTAWLQEAPSLYTELDAEVVIADTVFIGGNVRTDVRPILIDSYMPYWMTYDFKAGVRWRAVELGFRHTCTHPIQVYAGILGLAHPAYEGGYDEMYLMIGGGR